MGRSQFQSLYKWPEFGIIANPLPLMTSHSGIPRCSKYEGNMKEYVQNRKEYVKNMKEYVKIM